MSAKSNLWGPKLFNIYMNGLSVYIISILAGNLVGWRPFAVKNCWPWIMFMNVCVVITLAMVMLLKDFRSYGIIFVLCVVITVAMVMPLRDFGPYGLLAPSSP
jgi:hypothetical protein